VRSRRVLKKSCGLSIFAYNGNMVYNSTKFDSS
jgi:hypothetical protein